MEKSIDYPFEEFGQKKKKGLHWNEWADACPECGSTDLEKLNLYKGMYKKGNPLKKRNQQKCKCSNCQHEFWIEI